MVALTSFHHNMWNLSAKFMPAIAKRSLICCAGKNIRRRHFQVTERSSLVLKSYALPTTLKSMFSGKGLSILLSIGAFYTNCPIKQIEFSQENLNSKTGKQETHFSFFHLSGASFILLVRFELNTFCLAWERESRNRMSPSRLSEISTAIGDRFTSTFSFKFCDWWTLLFHFSLVKFSQ